MGSEVGRMLNKLASIGLLVGIGYLLAVLRKRRSEPRTQEIGTLARSALQGPAKSLVERIETVKVGDSMEQVDRTFGRADSVSDLGWIYYLDEHAGYLIGFDRSNRVQSVNLWAS
jgi:hypothetical protein